MWLLPNIISIQTLLWFVLTLIRSIWDWATPHVFYSFVVVLHKSSENNNNNDDVVFFLAFFVVIVQLSCFSGLAMRRYFFFFFVIFFFFLSSCFVCNNIVFGVLSQLVYCSKTLSSFVTVRIHETFLFEIINNFAKRFLCCLHTKFI